jgi:hypothetical protein
MHLRSTLISMKNLLVLDNVRIDRIQIWRARTLGVIFGFSSKSSHLKTYLERSWIVDVSQSYRPKIIYRSFSLSGVAVVLRRESILLFCCRTVVSSHEKLLIHRCSWRKSNSRTRRRSLIIRTSNALFLIFSLSPSPFLSIDRH